MSVPGELWTRWRVRAGYPLALVYAWLADPAPAFLLAGAAIALCGVGVRGVAAGYLRKQEALATSGPYAYTRNPLYFGSALLAAGFLVAGRSVVAAVLVGVYFALFYAAVMRREEQELRARHGAAFEEYARRVPLFFPRLTPSAVPRPGFSWALYIQNREYQTALGVLLGLAFLWMKGRG